MDIRVQVLHAGEVCVSPALPYGGESTGIVSASGVFMRQDDRIWLPVSAYLIDHPQGMVLVDTGWDRSMSPEGRFDKNAQIASLGSRLLYRSNQGVVDAGQTVLEQLATRGIAPEDLSCILLTHLDCDHVSGLKSLAGAPHVLASPEELAGTTKGFMSHMRYRSEWWDGVNLEAIEWNGTEGPFERSFDVFGDGRVVCIFLPGHTDGMFGVKVTGEDGRFVLICADAAFGPRSWNEMLVGGLATNREQQRISLEWIREQANDPLCVEVLATHDKEIEPHSVLLPGLPVLEPVDVEPVDEEDYLDLPEELRQNAGKLAVAAMLAASLSTAPINFDDFPLPDSNPIVQTMDTGGQTPPAVVADDQHEDKKASIWEKVINILKYVLLVVVLAASLLFAGINGCTSCAGQLGLPFATGTPSESSASASPASDVAAPATSSTGASIETTSDDVSADQENKALGESEGSASAEAA